VQSVRGASGLVDFAYLETQTPLATLAAKRVRRCYAWAMKIVLRRLLPMVVLLLLAGASSAASGPPKPGKCSIGAGVGL
jgi:hypothetical protein